MEITALTDTITIVNETLSQSDLIDPYKELIEAQRSTYNFLIYIFLGILGLFSFVAGYIYFKKTKDLIKENTKEIFDEERKNIISSIKEEYDKEFKELRKDIKEALTEISATSARLFATTIEDKHPANKMAWLVKALENYIEINQGHFITPIVQAIKHLCELLTEDDDLKKKFIGDCKKNLIDSYGYSFKYFIETINKIPDTLSDERNTIRIFFNSIKDEISDVKKEEEKAKSNSTNS
jgi:hypothetical protein